MTGFSAAPAPRPDLSVNGLFARIGAFLAEHRLSPDPAHYAFAYEVLSQPDGPLAASVAQLTDGGIRLSRHDIELLGGTVVMGQQPTGTEPIEPSAIELLVAQTELHVADFAQMVSAIQDETRDFGEGLAASAAAIDVIDPGNAIDEITALTGTMIARVRDTEVRLAAATEEAETLRAALDEARGNARSDPLTELPNRRAFDEAFAAANDTVPRCLAICDIDHFKQVNDRFGHAVGDRVLKAIAQTLAAECAGHLVARYGGEEFAILFAGITVAEAENILARAREAVARRRFRLRETDEPLGTITFSAGIATIVDGEVFGAAYGRADRALYAAKSAGRNCVKIAPKVGATRQR